MIFAVVFVFLSTVFRTGNSARSAYAGLLELFLLVASRSFLKSLRLLLIDVEVVT